MAITTRSKISKKYYYHNYMQKIKFISIFMIKILILSLSLLSLILVKLSILKEILMLKALSLTKEHIKYILNFIKLLLD